MFEEVCLFPHCAFIIIQQKLRIDLLTEWSKTFVVLLEDGGQSFLFKVWNMLVLYYIYVHIQTMFSCWGETTEYLLGWRLYLVFLCTINHFSSFFYLKKTNPSKFFFILCVPNLISCYHGMASFLFLHNF